MKDSNLKRIEKEVKEHKGELVIDMAKIVMLVGFTIGEDDYYYEFLDWNGETIKSSCVGNFIVLKGYLPKETYAYLCDVFYINAIEPYLKHFQELEDLIRNKIGRKPKTPIWG